MSKKSSSSFAGGTPAPPYRTVVAAWTRAEDENAQLKEHVEQLKVALDKAPFPSDVWCAHGDGYAQAVADCYWLMGEGSFSPDSEEHVWERLKKAGRGPRDPFAPNPLGEREGRSPSQKEEEKSSSCPVSRSGLGARG